MADTPRHRTIGRYELTEEIGHGGMATVYRGRDTRLDRPVAVKVMHPHLQKTPEARARFTREAKSVARLRHPNILEIYDNSDGESDEAFIVTELLTGPTLKVFRDGLPAMPAEVAAAITIEIASALECAHAAGIIHRDVKPENVLLHQQACLKLTDFGIAHMIDAQSFTATGQILGSPGHMAPEQIEGGSSDARTDVFALGTLLYYLATGRLPFEGQNAHQILRKVVEGDCLEPLRLTPAMGAQLSRIIEGALCRDVETRTQSATAFKEGLQDWLEEQGFSDSQELLRRYLKSPEAVQSELEASALRRALVLGKAAAKRRDIQTAVDHFNRALALDDGNREALSALARLGRQVAGRQAVVWTGVLLGLLGAGALVVAAWGAASPKRTDDPEVNTTAVLQDGGAQSPVVSVATDDGGPEKAEDAGVSRAALAGRGVSPPNGKRSVCFAPTPSNVSLAVDGAASVPWTASSRCQPLGWGSHMVEAIGAQGCCEPLSHRFVVRPGNGAQRVPLNLTFKSARFYVNLRAEGVVPPNGVVRLDDGTVGATREFMEVPMTTFRRRHSYRVEIPGFVPHGGIVELVAGAQVQVTVALQSTPEG